MLKGFVPQLRTSSVTLNWRVSQKHWEFLDGVWVRQQLPNIHTVNWIELTAKKDINIVGMRNVGNLNTVRNWQENIWGWCDNSLIIVHIHLGQEQNSSAPISWRLFHELVLLLGCQKEGVLPLNLLTRHTEHGLGREDCSATNSSIPSGIHMHSVTGPYRWNHFQW
jgi:hypothetical protein